MRLTLTLDEAAQLVRGFYLGMRECGMDCALCDKSDDALCVYVTSSGIEYRFTWMPNEPVVDAEVWENVDGTWVRKRVFYI